MNDVSGQILQKTQGSAVERELIANGNLVGTTGMGTDPNAASSGPNPTFVDLTNFDPTYRPINANYPAPTPGAYTVNAGDSLQSIAQGAYGDSKLWYLIADANGLSSNNELRVGQTLNIPNRVTDVHNSAGDFKPYDSSSVVGSTTPNLPNPPAPSDGGGCGAILGIIVLVIVVVVTVIFQQYEAVPGEVSAEAGTSVGASLAEAAAAGAAMDAATQLIGDAIGTHHGFDLLETVEAAGTAVLTGGGSVGGEGSSSIGGMMLQAAVRNATTQAVRLALHQQRSFSWSQLAESAAAAPVAAEVGDLAGQALNGIDAPKVLNEFVQGAVSSTVTQAMTGGKINAASVITDGFGNVQGDDLRAVFAGHGQQEQQLAQVQQQVMTSTGVGMPGDSVLFGPMGAAGAFGSYGANSVLFGTNPFGGSGAAADTGAYSAGSALFGPTGEMEGITPSVAASDAGNVGGAANRFVGLNGSYTVQAGDSYASIANGALGDERYASLLMYANGIDPTYTHIHGLQVGAKLNLPDMSSLSTAQMTATLSNGGQLLSVDQHETDARNAYAQAQAQLQAQSAAQTTLLDCTSTNPLGLTQSQLQDPIATLGNPLALAAQPASAGLRATGPVITQGDSGFLRGLAGDGRSVLEGPAPLSEQIGSGVRAVGDLIASPFIEVANQYRDDWAALNGATGGWKSDFAQQISAGNYSNAAIVEAGTVLGALQGTEMAMTFGGAGLAGARQFVSDTAASLRDMGAPDWKVTLAPYSPATLYSNPLPLQFERIGSEAAPESGRSQESSATRWRYSVISRAMTSSGV